MKNLTDKPRLFLPLILTAALAAILPGAAQPQNIVRVGSVALQPDETPAGWTLVSDSATAGAAIKGQNTRNLNEEVMIRIEEARLGTSLSSVQTQKFETDGKLIEIRYFGGVTEENMAAAYSTIAKQDLADAVVHKGRFTIAINSSSPSLIRTAVRALDPAPLDRIKILDVTLPKDERAKTEILANRYQRESLARHFEIEPRGIKDVLNQFFDGPARRQVTYVQCATIDDATLAVGPLRRMSKGKSRILAEGRFIVEIVGDDGWAGAAERLIMPRLLEVTAEENEALEAARKDSPEGDESSG